MPSPITPKHVSIGVLVSEGSNHAPIAEHDPWLNQHALSGLALHQDVQNKGGVNIKNAVLLAESFIGGGGGLRDFPLIK